MTEPTDAEILALALELGIRMRTGGGAIKLVTAALAKWGQPCQAEEPVAWVWRFSDGSFCETPFETRKACAQDAIGYEGEPVPLYLAPQPVARVALTDGAIWDWWRSENGLEDCNPCVFADFTKFVRAVESKHGIKGGQHGAE